MFRSLSQTLLIGAGLCTLAAMPAHAQTFTATGGPIPDDGTVVEFPLVVSGLSPAVVDTVGFGLETVCINATHTWDSDLEVSLVAPDGTTTQLFSGVGADGDNFTATCLNVSAASSIGSGTAPFTGTWKPMGTMGMVNNGQPADGTWKLRILDTYAFADAGNLLDWSITFGTNPATYKPLKRSNLPIVIINTGGASIPDEPKVAADLKIIDNGPGLLNHPTDPPTYQGPIGIEQRGNFSAMLPQKPWGFETRDSADAELDTTLLGLPSEHDWILLANYNDKVFCRNTLAYKLFEEMGHYAPRTRLCEVILNGEYQGIYVFTEKIKRDKNRVDIAKLDSAEVSGIDLTGGYIFKTDYWSTGNNWLSPYSPIGHPSFDVRFVYYYPDPFEMPVVQKTYLRGYVTRAEDALYGPSFADPATGFRAYLDLPSFMDYFFVNELSRNVDGFRKSAYYHKDRSDKDSLIHAGPVWDFDWAWKNLGGCAIFSATDGSGWAYHINDCSPDVNSPAWMIRMLQDPLFANALQCRWDSLRATALDTVNLFAYIDSIALLVDTAQSRHYERWPILDVMVGAFEVDAQPSTYAGHITKFKNWISTRLTWLDANMPGICTPVNVWQDEDAPLEVYPNPAQERVQFTSPHLLARVEVLRMDGALLLTQGDLSDGLDLSSLPNGMYLLRATLRDGQVQCGRLTVQR